MKVTVHSTVYVEWGEVVLAAGAGGLWNAKLCCLLAYCTSVQLVGRVVLPAAQSQLVGCVHCVCL